MFLLACFALIPLDAAAWDCGNVERFATLPAGSANPEGFPASLVRHGDWIYITSLSLNLRPIAGQQSVDDD